MFSFASVFALKVNLIAKKSPLPESPKRVFRELFAYIFTGFFYFAAFAPAGAAFQNFAFSHFLCIKVLILLYICTKLH